MSISPEMWRKVVDRDHTRAAKLATKRQTSFEAEASENGMTVEAYMRFTSTWPMSEGERPLSPSEIPRRRAQQELN